MLVVAEVDPAGDGVLLVRTPVLGAGEQLTWQLERLFEAADTAGRRPKLVVACAGVSGAKPLEGRPDLLAVLDALDRDRCKWLSVWSEDRIARSITTLRQFHDELQQRGATLLFGCVPCSIAHEPVERTTRRLALASAVRRRSASASDASVGPRSW